MGGVIYMRLLSLLRLNALSLSVSESCGMHMLDTIKSLWMV